MAISNKTLAEGSIVSKLTKTLKELVEVIKKENELLKIGKVSAIPEVVEEKTVAIKKFNDVQTDVEDFVRQDGKFDKTSSAMIKLKALFDEMNSLNKQNEVLIISNLEVSDKIIEMYKSNKTQETLRQFGYNKDGSVTVSDNIEKVMPAIGLNNKV